MAFTPTKCSDRKREIEKIDQFALVNRHNVRLTEVDTFGSPSVGNGEFAFTVDVSGLQTFAKEYENGISLGTQSQWAWHRSLVLTSMNFRCLNSNPGGFRLQSVDDFHHVSTKLDSIRIGSIRPKKRPKSSRK